MATLKIVALRLKSVKNIQKITQSMKMVSAAKYTRAERDLRAAKPYGAGAQTFFEVNTHPFFLSLNASKLANLAICSNNHDNSLDYKLTYFEL